MLIYVKLIKTLLTCLLKIYAGYAGVKELLIDLYFTHVYVLEASNSSTKNAFCNGYVTQKKNFANYVPTAFHSPQVSTILYNNITYNNAIFCSGKPLYRNYIVLST